MHIVRPIAINECRLHSASFGDLCTEKRPTFTDWCVGICLVGALSVTGVVLESMDRGFISQQACPIGAAFPGQPASPAH
jgi:hypothetical protein